MSKIEKALKRAKEQRQGSDQPHTFHENTSSQQTKITSSWAEEPVYTQTKIVPVNPEIFAKYGIVTPSYHPAVVEQYNLLRIKVAEALTSQGLNSILITSPGANEGKTLTAINLALSLARETSRTVLLVDADMRKPSIHRYLGLPQGPGLYEHLTEKRPLSELLINPGVPRLTVLPAGEAKDYPADLLGSPGMEALAREMKSRYPDRFVIFDSPALLAFSDALYLSRYTDVVITAARSGETKKEQLLQAHELLKDRNILGTVLNRVPLNSEFKAYYGYYD